MQSEMNRLFGSLFDSPTPRNGVRTSVRRWIPAMDVAETDITTCCGPTCRVCPRTMSTSS